MSTPFPPQNYADALQGLVTPGARGDLETRPVLLRVLTDLFVSRPHHSEQEITQFSAVAEGLLPKADDPTRLAVATLLAHRTDAPSAVVEGLIAAGGPPAALLLARGRSLSRERLQSIARTGLSAAARIVAARVDLDERLVEILLERGEAETRAMLAINPALPATSLSRLIEIAGRDGGLARILLSRLDLDLNFLPLFFHADALQRVALIGAAHRLDPVPVARGVRTVRDSRDAEEMLHAAAAGDLVLLAALVSRIGAMRLQDAQRIVGDPGGEPLMLVFAMLGAEVETIRDALSYLPWLVAGTWDRATPLAALAHGVAPKAARVLLNAMTTMRPKRQSGGAHQPVTDPLAASAPGRAVSRAHAAPMTPQAPHQSLRR